MSVKKNSRYIDGRALPYQTIFPLRQDNRCRFCAKPLAGKQTSWCSNKCLYAAVNEAAFRRGSSTEIRKRVFERDRGICAMCGLDGEKLQRISDAVYRSLRETFTSFVPIEDYRPRQDENGKYYRPIEKAEKEYFKQVRKLLRDTPLNPGLSCWQADHILEVAKGGAHHLDNLATLCNLCHKAKTSKFNRINNRKKPENNSTLKLNI